MALATATRTLVAVALVALVAAAVLALAAAEAALVVLVAALVVLEAASAASAVAAISAVAAVSAVAACLAWAWVWDPWAAWVGVGAWAATPRVPAQHQLEPMRAARRARPVVPSQVGGERHPFMMQAAHVPDEKKMVRIRATSCLPPQQLKGHPRGTQELAHRENQQWVCAVHAAAYLACACHLATMQPLDVYSALAGG